MELNKMPIASGKRNLSIKVAASAAEPGLLPWVGLDIGDDCGGRGMIAVFTESLLKLRLT